MSVSEITHPINTILRERYKLTNVVGKGGMGCVYRAEDLRLPGRLCAVKEVVLEGDSAESRQQMHDQFLREASVLAQLDHPNLPKVSDFFTDEDTNREYLVMDFVPGDDLKTLVDAAMRDGEILPTDTVKAWTEQILNAVSYLHKQQPSVLHRDIKPSNIKLTPDERIKLVDFGLVKLLSNDDLRTVTVLQGRGTALYTPLEQYGGDSTHTDVRSDIYSLGATLYQLFTSKMPPEARARFLNPTLLKYPHQLNPDIDKRTSDAILWAMAMHPDDRPDSVTQLQDVMYGDAQIPTQAVQERMETVWLKALEANRVALALAFLLIMIAIVITLT